MAYNTGILDTHQAPTLEKTDESMGPTDAEKKLCDQVNKIFEKHVKHRKKYDLNWIDNYKMFRGEQWLKKRPTYKHREVVNLISQAINSQHSTMMDVRPTVGFSPRDPSDLEFSQILTEVFEADWDRNNWSDEVAAVGLDGAIYGVGFAYAKYNSDLHAGVGGVEWCADDPFNHYPSAVATNVNKKSKAYVVAMPEEIDEVKLRYSGHKYLKFIKPDLEDMSYSKRTPETLHRRKNTDLDMSKEALSYNGQEKEDDDKVLVVTLYLLPSDTEEVEKEDLNAAGEKVYITRLKHPKGRKIVKINEYIFEDDAFEYDHLEIPYQRYVNQILPREFFGVSDIDDTKGPQMVFNKLINFVLDFLTLSGNPVWMSPVEANVNTRKLTNQPGLIVEYANGRPPERVEGPGLQPYVLELIRMFETWFNNQAGTQDVTRGLNPTGVTANSAIENLLEQAQKRVKQKMRNLDSFLKDFGRQWVSLVMQYYTAPQIFRLTNKEGANKYFKFHVEHRDSGELDPLGQPKKKRVAIVRSYQEAPNGAMLPAEQAKEYEIRGDFDVKASTITGLPFSKAEKKNDLLSLFDRGLLDDEEVLKQLDYPNYEQIIARMREKAAMAAQAEQGAEPAPAA